VDFQRDFTEPGGAAFAPRPSVKFVQNVVVPFFREKGIKAAEIVSDYRQPRPGDKRDICRPGERGFESGIPDDVRLAEVWIKSQNSPAWTRENAGNPDKSPGPPYPDPQGFTDWLKHTIGVPAETGMVVLSGLTLDRCVLCTAQELTFRGYNVGILREATDPASGDPSEREWLLTHPPVLYWARAVSWSRIIEVGEGVR